MEISQFKQYKIFYFLFFAAFSILTVCSILVIQQLGSRRVAWEWVTHTYEVIEKINQGFLNLIEAERQEQNYTSSNNKEYLVLYNAAIQNSQNSFAKVRELTLDNPEQQMNLDHLEPVLKTTVNSFQERLNAYHAGIQINVSAKSEALLNQIRKITYNMNAEELYLLQGRNHILVREIYKGNIELGVSAILSYVFLLAAFFAIIKLAKKSYQEQQRAQQLKQEKFLIQENLLTKLEFVLDTAQLGSWDLNLKTNAVQRTLKHDQIFGYSSLLAEWTYEKFREHVHQDDIGFVEQRIKDAIAANTILEFQCRIFRADDKSPRWIWSRGKLFKVDDIQHLVGLVQDITEKKEIQEALLDAMLGLKRSNQDLEQFAYVASHDLKAPLRAIASLSAWIEKDNLNKLSDESRDNLILLHQRAKRMGSLIDGILQYSRATRSDIDIAIVSVKDLLNEAIDNLNPPKSFIIHLAKNLPTMQTFKVQLSQVFSNLINNSIKYHDRLDGHIEVGVKDAGEFYEFYVADDGPGIDPVHHNKIFEMFQTLQSRDVIESTGIGLSIVKKIVESQGGKVIVDSSKGKGATFRFTWPKKPHLQVKNPINTLETTV